jgi:lipoprotein-anchoring transpeptidase ErfK/SrfK
MPRLTRPRFTLPAARRPSMWRTVGLVTALFALGATAACTGSQGASWNDHGVPGINTSPPQAASLTIQPGKDVKDFSPADPITVSISNGTLTDVSLTNPDGRKVQGEFNADKTQWTASEKLGYDKEYTFAITGTGADGQSVQQSSSFTTVKPGNLTLPYLRANVATLLDKGTFGVGQPIVVWFDEAIKDKAAAEKSLVVTTTPPGIVGGWYWMDDHEVHWRPKDYWPAGTKVHVEANVYGKNLGNGLYGQEDREATFTIGQSKIAVADSVTHRMKVYIDGKQVTTINGLDVTAGIPISMGKGGTETTPEGVVVDFTTNSGPHVVMMKYEIYRMTSASFGIKDPKDPNFYDTNIKKAIRITNDGEFVHLADWNIPQQGVVNTSHGCVNVGPNYIYWFYDQFGAGDIVNVTGTTRHLDKRNGLGDWVVPWDQWLKGSALAS